MLAMTEVQARAAELAAARNDYYLSVPGRATQGQGLIGPLSEQDMRMYVEDALAVGRKPLVLKVVEDYGK